MTHDVPDKMRIHLVIAAWRSQGSRTGYCYAETMRHLQARGHDVTHETWSNDAILERTRSIVLTRFLHQHTADVFVWADADTIWRTANGHNDVERLAASAYKTRGVVGAIYSKRGFGAGMTMRASHEAPRHVFVGADQLIPAELVGAGFMAIHRSALERIAEGLPLVHDEMNGDWFPFCKTHLVPEDDGRMHFVSEDEALCLNAIRCGVPLMCDVFPVLGHEGSHVFTVEDGRERKH